MKQLVKKILVSTKLTVVTGLHIGGSKDSVEIGGIDNPVIKVATRKNQPYVPGSSLKGKMRCLLEQVNGATKVGASDVINNLFGYTEKDGSQPSKLIVRDAYLSDDSVKKLIAASLDMPYTENKYENTIDRVKGKAEHPRQSERVPAGAEFDVEMVINVWDNDNADELKQLLQQGIALIENDYLGGSGSRGYGQVKFGELIFVELSADNNWKA
jgi:CRISPR-associated protein Csm3